MSQRITFDFDTRAYERTYSQKPRAYGSWAFDYRTDSNGNRRENAEPIFAPTSSYADAKKWIQTHIRSLAPDDYKGYITIIVLT